MNLVIIAPNGEACVRSMQYLKWETYDIEIQDSYSSLRSALTGCMKNSPDLILIHPWGEMRLVFDFCSAIIGQNPAAKIILAGAQRRYEYVQTAINMGIFAYLPMGEDTPEQFDMILRRVRDRQYIEQHSRHIVRRQLLRDILKGKMATPEEVEAYFGIKTGANTRYIFLLIRKDRPYPILEDRPEIDYYAVRWHTTILPEAFTYIATVNIEMETWGMLLKVDSSLSEHRFYTDSYAVARKMQTAYEEQRLSTVSIAISGEVKCLAELVPWTKRLQKYLDRSVFCGRRKIFTRETEYTEGNNLREDISRYLSWLRESVKQGGCDYMRQTVADAFDFIAKHEGSCEDLRYLCDQLLAILNALCIRNYLPTLEKRQNQGQCDFSSCYTLADVRDWFIAQFETVLSEIRCHAAEQYSEKVAELVKLIHTHYAQDYSVQDLAERVGLSSDYLRHIFKKETGQGIQKYMTEVRIENAKAMLERNDMRMADIAKATGFNTVQYFCSVFKRATGLSPKEYIKKHKNNASN